MTKFPIVHTFVFDTGAKYTCCSYKNIDRNLNEKDFENIEAKILGGIVSGAGIKFYRYHTRQFTVGNINLGEQDIWITFDSLATDDVLGMDLIQNVFYFGNAASKKLVISGNPTEIQELLSDIKNGK